MIEEHAEANGFGVVQQFVGHGIGETFHTALAIPHYYEPKATRRLEPGMVFTIEPMITVGDWRACTTTGPRSPSTASARRSSSTPSSSPTTASRS